MEPTHKITRGGEVFYWNSQGELYTDEDGKHLFASDRGWTMEKLSTAPAGWTFEELKISLENE